MIIDVTGRVAMITGTEQGIGREVLVPFAEEGAITVALDAEAGDSASAAAELEESGFKGGNTSATSATPTVPSIGRASCASAQVVVAHSTRALAGEVGRCNIAVNAYAPGMVPTTLNRFTDSSRHGQDGLPDTLSLRRWGIRQEVGQLACVPTSDLAGGITGPLLDVSGVKLATQLPSTADARPAQR